MAVCPVNRPRLSIKVIFAPSRRLFRVTPEAAVERSRIGKGIYFMPIHEVIRTLKTARPSWLR